MPSWVAGISIGAINAAIIAGNPPERRIERLRAFWEEVSSRLTAWPLANDDNSRKVFNETSAALAALWGRARLLRAARTARVLHAAGHAGSDQRLRLLPALCHAERAGRFRPAQLWHGPRERRRCRGAHRQHAVFRHESHKVGPEHIMASGALPPGLPPIDDRRQAVLGRRPALQHAAAACAGTRRPAARYGRLPDRSLQRARRSAGDLVRCRPAREGDPLFQPHPAQHRHLLPAAGHAPGHQAFAAERADRVRRQSALAAARPLELRRRHHHRAAHPPARRLLDAVQRLRILPLHHGGALAVGPRRCRAYFRAPILDETQAAGRRRDHSRSYPRHRCASRRSAGL